MIEQKISDCNKCSNRDGSRVVRCISGNGQGGKFIELIRYFPRVLVEGGETVSDHIASKNVLFHDKNQIIEECPFRKNHQKSE